MIKTSKLEIELLTGPRGLWRITIPGSGRSHVVTPPALEVDGRKVSAALADFQPAGPPNRPFAGVTEHSFVGTLAADPSLSLEAAFRVAEASPVVRFRYTFRSARPARMTKSAGTDALTYLSLSLAGLPLATEVRLSEFLDTVHSYCPSARPIGSEQFEAGLALFGPILVAGDGGHTLLVAYEHGSQVPDAFLEYRLDRGRGAALSAVKGNYHAGRPLSPESPYETIWFHLAAADCGQDELARAYRDFLLRHQSPNAASRKPYVFYNTWNCQERDKWFNGHNYLDAINQPRMLQEIDVAHRMGIDVFVVDTGWYVKTGDWRVNTARFDEDLKTLRDRLDGYGMKLGLWFDPTAAAVSSGMAARHGDCLQVRDGKPVPPRAIWETEDSHTMCLVSRYADAFADELIRLAEQVGVRYFKWDAITQYGCEGAGHLHGAEANPPRERAECYAFEVVRFMSRIVDKLVARCPEAIVDFDVTEGGRAFGLGFLASGKFFLINNGPYYFNYNLPTPPPGNINMFFYPGPARTWICRAPLDFDKWIPSVLLLTHYFPDDPESSRMINLASLILGQNGLWADLTAVSGEGVERIGRVIGLYKEVRDDITAAYPVRGGAVGGSPEVHEKIAPSGRGAICVFAGARGNYQYVSANPVSRNFWASEGAQVRFEPDGRARLDLTFTAPGAHIVLFGVEA